MASIINTYDQLRAAKEAGLPHVAICTHHSQGSRDNFRDGWEVVVPGVDISEGQQQHWSEYLHVKGRKRIFHRWHYKAAGSGPEQDKAALAAAIEWCATRFPVTQWARNRSGDYVDIRVNQQFPIPKREKVVA